MIKSVIFDIDDTLYSYIEGNEAGMKAIQKYVKDQFGWEKDDFMEIFSRTYDDSKKRLGLKNCAIHNRLIRFQNILEEKGVPLFPHARNLYHLYWNTLMEATAVEPGVLECMEELQNMGITIGIGTDMTAYIQYKKLEKYGVAPYVQYIITSEETGAEKPAPEFFERCIEKSKVEPEEMIFIGDNLKKDVLGAINSSMHPVWYNAKGIEPVLEFPEESYYEIHHFDELIDYIKSFV